MLESSSGFRKKFIPFLLSHKQFGAACKFVAMHPVYEIKEMLTLLLRAGIEDVSLNDEEKMQLHLCVKRAASWDDVVDPDLLQHCSPELKQIVHAHVGSYYKGMLQRAADASGPDHSSSSTVDFDIATDESQAPELFPEE